MMDAKDYEALNISEKTMKSLDGYSGTGDEFLAEFDPPIPMVEQDFIAKRFTYRALDSSEAFGLFGGNGEIDYFVQIGIVIPKSKKDGTHPIVEMGEGVSMSLVAVGRIIHAHGGEVTFERNNELKTISATFNAKVLFTHEGQETEHQIIGKKVFLNATGPL